MHQHAEKTRYNYQAMNHHDLHQNQISPKRNFQQRNDGKNFETETSLREMIPLLRCLELSLFAKGIKEAIRTFGILCVGATCLHRCQCGLKGCQRAETCYRPARW